MSVGREYLQAIDDAAEDTRRKTGWRSLFDEKQLLFVDACRQAVTGAGDGTSRFTEALISKLSDVLDEKDAGH